MSVGAGFSRPRPAEAGPHTLLLRLFETLLELVHRLLRFTVFVLVLRQLVRVRVQDVLVLRKKLTVVCERGVFFLLIGGRFLLLLVEVVEHFLVHLLRLLVGRFVVGLLHLLVSPINLLAPRAADFPLNRCCADVASPTSFLTAVVLPARICPLIHMYSCVLYPRSSAARMSAIA